MNDDELIVAVKRLVSEGEYLYLPGAAEVLAAPVRPPASAEAVDHAEKLIGHGLPPLLRRLYLEVGNGGFGPGFGILGVRGGHGDDSRHTAVELYEAWKPGQSADTKKLFPVCYWGCAIYSLVDCATTDGTMWGWDPNPVPPNDLQKALFIESITLHGWLERWLDRTINQPTVVEDAGTGEWRGATDDEHAQWAAEAEL
jgi:hypothetical protein